MTTLAVMKAAIADDISDTASTYTSQIARAITRAIEHYQAEPFWFARSRSTTFATVAAQIDYDVDDEPELPDLVRLDGLFITIDGAEYPMERVKAAEMEQLRTADVSGRPTVFGYDHEALSLYPTPDGAYTIRLLGIFKPAAPANDDEAGNPWMTHAYDLILSRAEWYLSVHTLKDEDMARMAEIAEARALAELRARTSKKVATGMIRPTMW